MVLGDKNTCTITSNKISCVNCEYWIISPDGKTYTGKTDKNGNFLLQMSLPGTYKVALFSGTTLLKDIAVKGLSAQELAGVQAEPLGAATDPLMVAAIVALVLIVLGGIAYWYMNLKKRKR